MSGKFRSIPKWIWDEIEANNDVLSVYQDRKPNLKILTEEKLDELLTRAITGFTSQSNLSPIKVRDHE